MTKMSAKKKPISVAEKIGKLVTDIPTAFGSDDESEDTKAKVVDYDEESDDIDNFKAEFNNSSIRKRNVNLLEENDKRYTVRKVSKSQIFNQDENSGESEEEGTEEDLKDSEGSNDITKESEEENLNIDYTVNSDDEFESSNKDDDESQSLDRDDDESGFAEKDDDDDEESEIDDDLDESVDMLNPLRRDRGYEKGIQTISATNVRAEIEKGNCVREQLRLWENLMEMRIKLQKCLINSNRMPQYDVFKDYENNNEFKKNCKETVVKFSGLLNNLLELQSNLLNIFPETKNILVRNKKRKAIQGEDNIQKENDLMGEEIPSDTEDEMNDNNQEGSEESEDSERDQINEPSRKKIKVSEFESVIAKNHKSYKQYRDNVIQKWNEKTRVASGIIKKGVNQPVIKQIEFALVNRDKLLKKTQLKRSEYEIVGKSVSCLEDNDGRRIQEYDSEIYDDDDFYHQLLRELIEIKSADITDPVQLSKQWIQLQNMRNKMKRKIDTRATKGRRIRYNIHQKLLNFMAPNTVLDTWTDHAKNELYSSLFGKIKPRNEKTKTT